MRRRFVPGLLCLSLSLGMVVAGAPHGVSAQVPVPATLAFAPRAETPLPDGSGFLEVDPATQRIFVSSPASDAVTVLDKEGTAVGSIAVPGAGPLLADGSTLYVVSTTAGRIDAFNTSTLAPSGSYGAGALVNPKALVKAGGRLWTTTGECWNGSQLVSLVPETSVTTVHPTSDEIQPCFGLGTSPTDANLLLAFPLIDRATFVRFDVSTGVPVETASLPTDQINTMDVEFMPDGRTFAVASGWPHEIRTFRLDPLDKLGLLYPTGQATVAVEATAAAGGMVAVGRDPVFPGTDVEVFRLGDPSVGLMSHTLSSAKVVVPAGLAFSPDGTRLYALSRDGFSGPAILMVFGPPDSGGRYHPVPPTRILDTRQGGPGARLGSGQTADVQVTGQAGIPLRGVWAVAMNVTVTQPTTTSFLTLYPAGTPRPLASNLNFTASKTVANLVIVKVGSGGLPTDGKVSMYNFAGATDVIVDVAGWYSDPAFGTGNQGRYTAVVPSRLLDTRDSAGGGVRLGPGAALDLQVAGRGGVPGAGAMAAVLNVVATETTATSFLTVYPTGTGRPLASNLNFNAGDTVSNRTTVELGAGGKVTIYNLTGSADVVIDVGGWYSNGSAPPPPTGMYTPLSPARILDTRDDTGGILGPIAANTAVAVKVTGRGGVPATGVRAVILNTTAVDPAGIGFLTISPTGTAPPLASDVNYAAAETRPNLTLVRVGPSGTVDVYTSTTTHVVFDVAGWMS